MASLSPSCQRLPGESKWSPTVRPLSQRNPQQALELVLTGDTITAERARELGLVNWLVPESELQATVNEVIAKVTAQSGPVLTMAKKAILGSLGLPLRDGVRNSMKVFLNELSDLEDSQEGLRALVEKRAPHWKNR